MYLCLEPRAQRAFFFFSREKRVHKVSCDRLEGCVCRSEEDGSRL